MNCLVSLNSMTNFVKGGNTTKYVDFTKFVDMCNNLVSSFTSTSSAPYAKSWRLYLCEQFQTPYAGYSGKQISISNKMTDGNCIIIVTNQKTDRNINPSIPTIYAGALISVNSGTSFSCYEFPDSSPVSFSNAMSNDGKYAYLTTYISSTYKIYRNSNYANSNSWNATSITGYTTSNRITIACSADGKYVCAGFTYVNNSTNTTLKFSNDYGVSFTSLYKSTDSSLNSTSWTARNLWVSADGATIYCVAYDTGSSKNYLFKLTNVVSGNIINSTSFILTQLGLNTNFSPATDTIITSLNVSDDMTYVYLTTGDSSSFVYRSNDGGVTFSNLGISGLSTGKNFAMSGDNGCGLLTPYGPQQTQADIVMWNKSGNNSTGWTTISTFSNGASASLGYSGLAINNEGSMAAMTAYNYGLIYSTTTIPPNNRFFISNTLST